MVILVNDADHYDYDSNLNITALHLTLEEYAKRLLEIQQILKDDEEKYKSMSEEEVKQNRAKRKKEGIIEFYARWPQKLHIQLDSASQNKCQAFMWYCANLVRCDIFKSV